MAMLPSALVALICGCSRDPGSTPASREPAPISAPGPSATTPEPRKTVAEIRAEGNAVPAPAAAASTVTLPFSITLGAPFSVDGMPGLQSHAQGSAVVGGSAKWLFVTGMLGGVHGFSAEPKKQADNFPRSGANSNILVVDPVARKAWSRPVSDLASIQGFDTAALGVSNAQATQVGDQLFVVGGYGFDPNSDAEGHMDTFDTLTVIDVPAAIAAVMAGSSPAAAFRQTRDPALRVTGGGLARVGDQFLLPFGQIFQGLYSPVSSAHGTFDQIYLPRVVVFTVTTSPSLAVQVVATVDLTQNDGSRPRRRDFTTLPTLLDNQKPAMGLYGGVFSPKGFRGFLEPFYLAGVSGSGTSAQITPGLDSAAKQLLSQYDCAALPVYDAGSRTMHTVFLGGISQFWHDPASGTLKKDPVKIGGGGKVIVQDGLPYIKTVSVLTRAEGGNTTGSILPATMPDYLGASGQLLLDPAVPVSSNGVVLLRGLSQATTVGHVFGGIRSTAPYSTQSTRSPATTASNLFIPVTVTPGNATATAMPSAPALADDDTIEVP